MENSASQYNDSFEILALFLLQMNIRIVASTLIQSIMEGLFVTLTRKLFRTYHG
jgi:hypothetical protein